MFYYMQKNIIPIGSREYQKIEYFFSFMSNITYK